MQIFGDSVLGDVGFGILKHGSYLATVNLMRGVNVSPLLRLDNLLWSAKHGGIMFDKISLKAGEQGQPLKAGEQGQPLKAGEQGCPYMAVAILFLECLEVSTGLKSEGIRIPWDVNHLLGYLVEAGKIDKRLITNHSAIRLPGERIVRNCNAYRFLRHQVEYEVKKGPGHYQEHRRYSGKNRQLQNLANNVHRDLASKLPLELFEPAGLHPFVDYWAREGRAMRGLGSRMSKCPLTIPSVPYGTELDPVTLGIEVGKMSIALHRDPFEHPFGPFNDHVGEYLWKRPYNILQIEELLNCVDPKYGPSLEASFMVHGIWDRLDLDHSKPALCYWSGPKRYNPPSFLEDYWS
ncbi:hypothetical protein ACQJBY_055889 [Aegilops geniculata]